jgi:hypothetical protein
MNILFRTATLVFSRAHLITSQKIRKTLPPPPLPASELRLPHSRRGRLCSVPPPTYDSSTRVDATTTVWHAHPQPVPALPWRHLTATVGPRGCRCRPHCQPDPDAAWPRAAPTSMPHGSGASNPTPTPIPGCHRPSAPRCHQPPTPDATTTGGFNFRQA